MEEKNLEQLLLEIKPDGRIFYRVYEESSEIPLFYKDFEDGFWYENLDHNKIVTKENFYKLYLIPNFRIETETKEPTINFTLRKINRVGLWEKFCGWKGWDYYMTAEKINNWEEEVKIPISKAKEWNLI